MKVAIQSNVWSPERHQDLPGLLAEVAGAGYDGFEIGAHRIDLTQPERFKAQAAECGLAVAGLHIHGELHTPEAMPAVFENAERVAGFGAAVGASTVLISGRPKPGKTEADYRAAVEALERLAKICQAAGMPLCYHTHNWELLDDMRELRFLMAHTDPALLGLALDVGWVKRAGYDPVAALHEFAAHIRYLHIKDTRDDAWIEVGAGTVDFAAVLEAMRARAYDGWLTVERDEVLPNAAESAQVSREHLRQLGV